MTLKELQIICAADAKDRGWFKPEGIPIPEQVALIHSEASEALESWRENEPQSWTSETGKPMGLASEYADVIIRIGHYATILGIDLEYEVQRKMEYNRTRPHRHGGKAA